MFMFNYEIVIVIVGGMELSRVISIVTRTINQPSNKGKQIYFLRLSAGYGEYLVGPQKLYKFIHLLRNVY